MRASYASGDWGRYQGPALERLQELCRRRFQVAHALPCSSGTIAVELALRGAGVRAGDEVILAGYDFPGNFRAIEAVGARPVLVDLATDRWTLNADQLDAACGPETKAVIASHLHGHVAPLKSLAEIAERRGLVLIEDACQAAGAVVQGKEVGAWGQLATLSFGGSKLLTAGRGGMVLTNDEGLRQRIVVATERGNQAFPLSELQAAVLAPQFETLDPLNQHRRERFAELVERLPEAQVSAPSVDDCDQAAAFRWGLFVNNSADGNGMTNRDRLGAMLRSENIPLDPGFRGFASRGSRRCRKLGDLPNARRAAADTLLVHHGLLLADDQVLRRATEVIQTVFERLADTPTDGRQSVD